MTALYYATRSMTRCPAAARPDVFAGRLPGYCPRNHPVVPSLATIASRSDYRIDRQTTMPMMPSTKARLRILRRPDMRRLQMSDDTLAGVQSSSA